MKSILAALLLVISTAPLLAIDDALQKEIETFFKLAKVEEKYEVALIEGFKAGSAMADLEKLPPEQRQKMEAGMKRVEKLMLSEMGWDKVKPDFVEMYAEHYTVAELKKINQLLKTPEMQKMVDAEIAMLPKSMQVSQKKTRQLIPRIQQIMFEEMSK